MKVSRRTVLEGLAASCCGALYRSTPPAEARPRYLLDPDRLDPKLLPQPKECQLHGACEGKVSFIEFKHPASRVNILFFHGYMGEYRSSLPQEYPLFENYNFLFMHRPGYQPSHEPDMSLCGHCATALEWRIDGQQVIAPGADHTARIAAALLDELHGDGRWRVAVIGMSGGGPAALAFAARYPRQTKGLILQAAVTTPWWKKADIAREFRDDYEKAVADAKAEAKKNGITDEKVIQQNVTKRFGANIELKFLAKLSKGTNLEKALVGRRAQSIANDPATRKIRHLVMAPPPSPLPREDRQKLAAGYHGCANDFVSLFRSAEPFCDFSRIAVPTLIVHDREDPMVPIDHAHLAKRRIKGAKLREFEVGGHMIWIGRQSAQMHKARVKFLEELDWRS